MLSNKSRNTIYWLYLILVNVIACIIGTIHFFTGDEIIVRQGVMMGFVAYPILIFLMPYVARVKEYGDTYMGYWEKVGWNSLLVIPFTSFISMFGLPVIIYALYRGFMWALGGF